MAVANNRNGDAEIESVRRLRQALGAVAGNAPGNSSGWLSGPPLIAFADRNPMAGRVRRGLFDAKIKKITGASRSFDQAIATTGMTTGAEAV